MSHQVVYVRQSQQKNEGEPLHIVSPSTIPLTLGEEMAVLVLPKISLPRLVKYRNIEKGRKEIFSNSAPKNSVSEHFDQQYRNCRRRNSRNAGGLADCAGPNVPEFLNYFVRQTRDA